MATFLKTILALLIVALPLSAQSEAEAEQLYQKGEYEQAAQQYEEILKSGQESAALFYNLGNCHYKLNHIAPAILYYERALLLNPGDQDTRFNLEVAKLKTVDKIESVGKFWLSEWSESIQNLMNANLWAQTAIVSFMLLLACIALYFLAKTIALKKIGFFAGLLFMLLTTAAHLYGSAQYSKMTHHDYAIIFAPTVTIKSTPDNSGTDLFVLHEGTKVKVKSTLGDWSEIELSDGNVGWVPSTNIERI